MSLQGTLNFGHGSDDPLYFGQNRFLTPIQIDIKIKMILSILVDTFISKISFPMQPGPEIGSISDA